MQSIEDKKAYNDVVFKTCLSSNLVYLLAHIAYLIFFLVTKSYVLVYINIGSVTFYVLMFVLIKFKFYDAFADLCLLEILAYMVTATLLTGFNTGFHLCIIGLCIIAFYTAYFSTNNRKKLYAVYWSVISMIIYIALLFVTKKCNPYYVLDDWASSTLFVVHTVIVFGFIGGYMHIFTKYVIDLEERIKKESRTDRLTNVPNRYALYNYLDSLTDKHNYALSILDIDDFKKINDIYGHICGDFILKEISNVLIHNHNKDFIARYGGEEFIIISKINTILDDTVTDVDCIRQEISDKNFMFDNISIHATVTIGMAIYTDNITIDEWINTADNKLYEGKKSGKNKTVV